MAVSPHGEAAALGSMYSQATVSCFKWRAVLSGDREGEKPKTGKRRGAPVAREPVAWKGGQA